MKIFVSIASYRDSELLATIWNAVEHAARPQNLYFSVYDQTCMLTFTYAEILHKIAPHIHYKVVDYRESRGPCHARSIANSVYNGEDYALQIDSHMRFDHYWDLKLIAAAQEAAELSRNNKVIVSTYPRGYKTVSEVVDVLNYRHISVEIDSLPDKSVLQMKPRGQLPETGVLPIDPSNPVVMFDTRPVRSNKVIPAIAIAAGALFVTGNFIREVPYDCNLYFHGEEQSLALRAFTRGWDMFHMPNMPLAHHYYTVAKSTRPRHWDVDDDTPRKVKWTELNQHAMQRFISLLNGKDQSLKEFGLGNIRSLREYAIISGIDYENFTIKRHELVTDINAYIASLVQRHSGDLVTNAGQSR